ncbi:MAG: ComEA family DNA-binding protein [Ruthenibacterium lactatiformans]
MGRRFAAAWWAALCAVLVCLCATAPPVRQAEYPPWDGAPYFDAGPDRVDVNTAPAAELETLPGIGEKALAIVEYREANGPFRAVEELERVKGISERTVDGMRAYVRFLSREHGGAVPAERTVRLFKGSFLWNSHEGDIHQSS